MHVRTCTRRPLVCLPPPARRRPSHRGRPRWLHPAVRRAGAAPFSCPEPAATVDLVAGLLLEAAEIHARLTDGADPEWPSWFADWLVERAGLPGLLDTVPSRSELVYLLVLLDKETADTDLPEPWEQHYARRIVAHFRS